MRISRVLERPRQQLTVDVGFIRLNIGYQLIDEILMAFQNGHQSSVPPLFRGIRNPSGGNTVLPMNERSPCSSGGDRTKN
jgi:hypothetical protein